VAAAPAEPHSHKPAFVVGGLGVAALGVGAYFGLHSQSIANDLASNTHTQSDANSLNSSGKTAAHVADVLFAAAAVCGVAAVLLW
jgi:hypothetical protein